MEAHARRVSIAVIGVAGFLGAVLVAVALLVPGLPRLDAPQRRGAERELSIDGDLRVPVAGPIGEVASSDGRLTVYDGVAAISPDFDLLGLGVEQPLVRAAPKWDPQKSIGDVPVVYIGDVNDRSIFLHTNGTISGLQRAFDWARGQPPDGIHVCLSYGVADTIGGQGFCGGPIDAEAGTVFPAMLVKNGIGPIGDVIAWIGVPDETAVVKLELANNRCLWQRPVSNVAFFDLEGFYSDGFTMTAIDAQGRIVEQR